MTAEFPWISVGVATDYRGNPRVFTASATGHGTSAANATVVATARSRGSSRGKLHRTNNGNPRKSAETAVTISTAIRGYLPRQRGNHHGSPRQLPRQFPRTSNRSNFHGHPRPSASIASAILRYEVASTEVRGSPRLLPPHVPRFCPWQTPSYQSCPRPSGPVAVSLGEGVSVDLSMDVRGRFRGQVRGCFHRRVRGCVRGRCRGCFRGRFRR